MRSVKTSTIPKFNFAFWFHLLITLLAWLGPFLFSWYLMVSAYGIVLLQFLIFNRCLLNAAHDLDNDNDNTFYAHLFELLGFQPNKKVLRLWVRRYVYLILAAFTLFWQLGLDQAPLLF